MVIMKALEALNNWCNTNIMQASDWKLLISKPGLLGDINHLYPCPEYVRSMMCCILHDSQLYPSKKANWISAEHISSNKHDNY